MTHRNRWFTVVKNGGSFHGKWYYPIVIIVDYYYPIIIIILSHYYHSSIIIVSESALDHNQMVNLKYLPTIIAQWHHSNAAARFAAVLHRERADAANV
jgi:hypothetical protein